MIKQAKLHTHTYPKLLQFDKNVANTILSSTFIHYVNNTYVYNFIFINSRNHIKTTFPSNSAHTIKILTWIIKTSFFHLRTHNDDNQNTNDDLFILNYTKGDHTANTIPTHYMHNSMNFHPFPCIITINILHKIDIIFSNNTTYTAT